MLRNKISKAARQLGLQLLSVVCLASTCSCATVEKPGEQAAGLEARLKTLNPFYKQHVVADGLLITSSEKTSMYALHEVAYLAKNMLARLINGDGFGIPVDASRHYHAQMQSEKKVEKAPGKWEWQPIKKTHGNNHLWDCEVMIVVGACILGVLKATIEVED